MQRVIRFFFVIGIIGFSSIALLYMSTFTYPFLFAIIFALCINPLVDFLAQKGRLPRGLSVIISLLLIFSALVGCIILLVTEIVSGTTYLATVIPNHIETSMTFIEQFITHTIIPFYNETASLFNQLDHSQQQTIIQNIETIGQTITTDASQFLQNSLKNIPAIIGWFPSTATTLIFSLMATFFISKDWHNLVKITTTSLPQKISTGSKRLLNDLKHALLGFITAQFTFVSLTTLTILTGLLILRVDHPITIALICGLLDIIPYLGTGTIFIPWIIYTVLTQDPSFAIALSTLYLIVLVQRQLIEPKVLSSSIGLNPLATLIALYIGYKWLGFLGLIIGPIVLVILKTLYQAKVFHDIWTFILGKKAS